MQQQQQQQQQRALQQHHQQQQQQQQQQHQQHRQHHSSRKPQNGPTHKVKQAPLPMAPPPPPPAPVTPPVDNSLVPPIRQTASIFKQPVTVVKSAATVRHNAKIVLTIDMKRNILKCSCTGVFVQSVARFCKIPAQYREGHPLG